MTKEQVLEMFDRTFPLIVLSIIIGKRRYQNREVPAEFSRSIESRYKRHCRGGKQPSWTNPMTCSFHRQVVPHEVVGMANYSKNIFVAAVAIP